MLKAVDNATGYTGKITGLYADVLQGWALHTEQPGVRLAVEIYIDGAYVALTRADQMQHEYEEGDGFHGFAVPLRKSWLQNATVISVRIANHGPWLDGTVQLPESKPKDPSPGNSQVWYSGGLTVTGWACHATDADRYVTVIAREGDKVVASTVADRLHPLLVNNESADHGFNLDLPWEFGDGKSHLIHLENENGQPLAGSPITVFFRPEGLETLLRCHWNHKHNHSAFELLLDLANERDRRAPQTIGFSHYAKWFDVFQTPSPLVCETPLLKAGILLYGEGTELDEYVSRASIQSQRWSAHAVTRAKPDSLPQAAHQLLMQGVDAIVPLHIGDRLAPHALDMLLPQLHGEGAAAWVYADSDCDGPNGERTSPWLKPGWDIHLFLCADIVTLGSAYSARLVRASLSLPTHPPTGDIDGFAAAVAAAIYLHKMTVAHFPQVLYHQRHGAPTSPADAPINIKRQDAVQWLSNIIALGAQVSPNPIYPGLLRTHWPLPSQPPRVSLIVPTRDQHKLLYACVEGLLTNTDYPDIEVIVVNNDSTDPKTLAYLAELNERGVKILPYPHPFNYSDINNKAVAIATGSIIGLINNDIEILDKSWLKTMVAQLMQPRVGIVGAKLIWPNGMVQHGGVTLGVNALAAHTGNTWHTSDSGYLGLNHIVRCQSAVTAACMLLRKADYEAVGGLNPIDFPITFNDVDLCLKISKLNLDIIWTPYAELIHAESASRGKDYTKQKRFRAIREQEKIIERIFREQYSDKYYHPGLTHDSAYGPYNALNANSIDFKRKRIRE